MHSIDTTIQPFVDLAWRDLVEIDFLDRCDDMSDH